MRSHYRVRIQIGGVGALDVFTRQWREEINWCQYQKYGRNGKQEKLSRSRKIQTSPRTSDLTPAGIFGLFHSFPFGPKKYRPHMQARCGWVGGDGPCRISEPH